ncbi:tRNA lysidine(34) synthetase TilS [Roseovarius gahaiensis]|uniref:tRNA(Ile)-lysidine synthase n=1 Tax=Roseovarius gahaiensis TaxID=2716691 RepID=A0A967BEM6_9RHOB|nr:tRNA lysidine(34) synthetase TilS [Roseovarius gahaiensis]NHQ74879.1 tRNA lysidine(34) synthetase TilS [Roseovarius gahaiensis]
MALCQQVTARFSPSPPARLGVAVSGGSDSTALLILLHKWQQDGGPALHAVTVDHGLRPEAAEEAAHVARLCDGLGVPHEILHWQGWTGRGNLPDAARQARYALLSQWAVSHDLQDVALGHTATDQAETFLMRLAREAGVDGLSAMRPKRAIDGVTFWRPLLDATRESLRAMLRARGVEWVDDPTNEDQTYERVRARQALTQLESLGLDATQFGQVTQNLADVRDTLYHYALDAARNIARIEAGDLILDHAGFLNLPAEIARRVMQESLKWVSGAAYGPRGRAMEGLLVAVAQGDDKTLHGCRILHKGQDLRITREYQAVADQRAAPGSVWDGRWRLSGPQDSGLVIAALGKKGARQCPDRQKTGLPAASLWASPAVWNGEKLVAAPLAGLENGWSAHLLRDETAYFDAFVSH